MHEKLKELAGKKIAILGLGIENFALIKFLLHKKINCLITIHDNKNPKELGTIYDYLKNKKNISWELGNNRDQHLDGFDMVFRSPGWPLFDLWVQKAKELGVEICSPMNFFFALCPTENIVGVTGTKGKGTTATLIRDILLAAGKKVWLGGNIGIAPFSFINKIRKIDWVVLELSSFQLEDMTASPHIAVMTNFYSEHMSAADPNNPNFHKNNKQYFLAKLNIMRWQKNYDRAIINKSLKKILLSPSIKNKIGSGTKIYFNKTALPTKLIGAHNQENIAAAMTVARFIGINKKIVATAVKNYSGLEYRLQFVRRVKGVDFFNDSFATTPEATITALKSFKKSIILLAGGAEKNAGFVKLASIIKTRVKLLILFDGTATPRLKKKVLKTGYQHDKIIEVESMAKAVKTARRLAEINDVVLLSPACASFGMFKNYKERGKLFRKEVGKL